MYAVIETGGKQYRVEIGTELEVELLDVEPGKTITLERVLLVAEGAQSSIGRPLVAGAQVSAEVLRQTRGEKLIAFKYRPKARSRVKKGHRQELTVLRISDITLGGRSAATSARKAHDDAKTERQRLEEAAVILAAKDAALAAKLAVGSDAPIKPASEAKATPVAAPKPAARKAAAPTTTAKTARATAAKPVPGKTKPAPAKPSATSGKAETAPSKAKPAPSKAAGTATTRTKASADAPKSGRASKPGPAVGGSAAKAPTPRRTRAPKKDE